MRKICVITGTRAEYGLLYWLMKEIQNEKDLVLKIIATGMHLSPEFGLTGRQIEKDGFQIDKNIEMLLSSDSEVGVAKSMGLGMIGFADAFSDLKPDLIVVLGDRFELLSAVSTAMIAKIPIAHIHGGELTEGAFDESIRHSITKMSHLHFTATEEYKKRVIQLGECPDRVFNVGAVGVDNIKKLILLSREEFEKSIDFSLAKRNLLITFHPATLEYASSEKQFDNLLQVLDEQVDTHLIFTKSNADTDSRIINKMIDTYVINHPDKSIAYTSLGQLRYLSAMQYIDGVVGNSSSGLLEAPSFKVGTINIGDRQRGRIKADSVIDCNTSIEGIQHAFERLFSKPFQSQLQQVKSPYGNGGASDKILEIIRSFPLDGILKKTFYDFD
jgi:GDP/UDP-N,N'-diacetylbacillosamine 2-epimerase (hydrolysing)